MDSSNRMQRPQSKILLVLLLLLIVGAAIFGWQLGRDRPNTTINNDTNTSAPNPTNNPDSTNQDVKSLISYSLPDGWKEGTCPNNADRLYIIPAGEVINCDADPSAPIKLSVDPQNTTDCQQLANPQNVRKHVCASLFIDGHKSLKSSTEYLKSSSLGKDITLSDYYIDTGRGVVKVEYAYTTDNDYQNGFDRFATSLTVKN